MANIFKSAFSKEKVEGGELEIKDVENYLANLEADLETNKANAKAKLTEKLDSLGQIQRNLKANQNLAVAAQASENELQVIITTQRKPLVEEITRVKALLDGLNGVVTGTPETEGEGTPEAEGEGTPEAEGEGTPEAEGEGTPEAEGEGTPEAEGEGTPEAEGEGTPETEGEGTPETEGEGTPEAEGEGTPEAEGEGTPEAEGEGTPEAEGEGTPEAEGEGTPEAEEEDLSRIKGIGAKIEAALSANGIKNYKQLSTATVDRINNILFTNSIRRAVVTDWIKAAKKLVKK